MHVLIFRCLLLFALLSLSACGKSQFSLDYNLEENVTDNFNVTYYATGTHGGKTIQAVASVRDGRCELKCYTMKPTLVYVTAKNSRIPLVFLAERGKNIEITGKGRNPLLWEVEGNKINSTLTEWRLNHEDLLTQANTHSINSIVADFVTEHPDNEASLILLLCYYNKSENEKGYSELMHSLDSKVKDREWLTMVARADQLNFQSSAPAILNSLVLRAETGNLDTIRINRRDPIFLLFWPNNYSERHLIVDSLKVLEKDYPDSVRLIADVCLDVDSVMWRQAIKRDSLKTVKRLWEPSIVTNPSIGKLKVNTLPYYIVFDSIGYQTYRGNNLGDAIQEYRNLLSH